MANAPSTNEMLGVVDLVAEAWSLAALLQRALADAGVAPSP